LKFVVSAGGTAGHINPALAVAKALRSKGATVLYAGTPDSLEERLVTAEGFDFVGFYAKGLNRRKPWTFPSTALRLNNGRLAAKRWMRQAQPDAVATFGGYASLPSGLAAISLGYPLLVHEQNARPGLANRLLARKASVLAISDERAVKGFSTKARIEVTGNPLRAELFGVDPLAARESLGLSPEARVLLVFGGSLGAHHINASLLDLARQLLDGFADLEVMHVTGAADYEWASQLAKTLGLPAQRWQVREYCYEMGNAYAASDLIIARAGATSLAEFTALGKAALLVPYPYAAADEQTANAELLSAAKAAYVWPDDKLDDPGFRQVVFDLLEDDGLRGQISVEAKKLGKPDATEAIAKLIVDLV